MIGAFVHSGQSASGLQASQEATWAMAASATSRSAVHNTRSRSGSISISFVRSFVGIMRFDLDDLAFDLLRFLVLRAHPLDLDGSIVSARDVDMFGRPIECAIHQIGERLNIWILSEDPIRRTL